MTISSKKTRARADEKSNDHQRETVSFASRLEEIKLAVQTGSFYLKGGISTTRDTPGEIVIVNVVEVFSIVRTYIVFPLNLPRFLALLSFFSIGPLYFLRPKCDGTSSDNNSNSNDYDGDYNNDETRLSARIRSSTTTKAGFRSLS